MVARVPSVSTHTHTHTHAHTHTQAYTPQTHPRHTYTHARMPRSPPLDMPVRTLLDLMSAQHNVAALRLPKNFIQVHA